MSNEVVYTIIAIGVGVVIAIFFGNAEANAHRTIRMIFKNRIKSNPNIDLKTAREELGGLQALMMQTGKVQPTKFYLELKKVYMDSLTATEKAHFIKYILTEKLEPKHLLKIDNSNFVGSDEINLVLGLFEIPSEKKSAFIALINEYIKIWEEDAERRAQRAEAKSLVTNLGICPKCMSKISQFARKCPYCTTDLN